MDNFKTIFLQQSYRDAWDEYARALKDADAARWDYILLTASDENQAETYRAQIRYRVDNGFLPDRTHYAVLPDPDGKRVGSGGATLNALRYVAHREKSDRFDGLRILVIHSGGDSKRIPQYSACGKIFSPVPRELPDGRDSTLFDELIVGMSGVAARMSEGMLVMSGDVLMLFNPLQIDFCTEGAAALTIKESPTVGERHGVYQSDADGNVGRFLHKRSADELRRIGAVDAGGKIHIDTGAVILDGNILRDLYSLVSRADAFDAFVNERARLSFYADFLFPMATGSALDAYLRETPEGEFTPELEACRRALWDVLHKYRIRLMRLSPAAFLHFGTTKEVLRLMHTDMPVYAHLGWQGNIHTNNTDPRIAARNSYIHTSAVIGDGSYIEDSFIGADCRIGKNCVVSGAELHGAVIPDDTVLHALRLRDGKFTVRVYGVADNPKEPLLFGEPIPEPLWSYAVCPVCDTLGEAVAAALSGDPAAQRISLRDGFALSDGAALLSWQQSVRERVCAEIFLDGVRSGMTTDEALRPLRQGCSEGAVEGVLRRAENADAPTRIRVYHALSCLPDLPQAKQYGKQCFAAIREQILETTLPSVRGDGPFRIAKDKTQVCLPARVNLAGGWTDTPPHCIERGGTVLNAAVLLEDTLPIRAYVQRIDAPHVVLSCLDNNASQVYTQTQTLLDLNNPFDQFAIQKAALIVLGVGAAAEKSTLPEFLESIGGGFSFVTSVVHIPRGSGLGTSSILAAACVRALAEFFGIALSDQTVYSAVLCMEQLMSTGGGWQDQVGGVVPGIKMIRSEPGLPQIIRVDRLQLSASVYDALEERFCLVYTGQRRLARNLLREVVGRYIAGEPQALQALSSMQDVAHEMHETLLEGNLDAFASLLDRHWEYAKQLDSGCTNTCIEHIFRVCADLTAGKAICGAGGGGFLQIVLKDGVTKRQLAERLLDVYSDSGVQVWDSRFCRGGEDK